MISSYNIIYSFMYSNFELAGTLVFRNAQDRLGYGKSLLTEVFG
jgi:hypothetical protein